MNDRLYSRRILILAVCWLLPLVSNDSHAQSIPIIESWLNENGQGKSWVLQPGSGRLFVNSSDETLIEYDLRTGERVGNIELGQKFAFLAIKNESLVAASEKGMIAIVDLETNHVRKTFAVKRKKILSLACSQNNNDFLYCAIKGSKPELLQLDIKKGTVRNRTKREKVFTPVHDPSNFAIRADGRMLVDMHANRYGGGYALNLFRMNEDAFKFDWLGKAAPKGNQSVTFSLAGQHWVAGNQVFSERMKHGPRTFDCDGLEIHPVYDLMVMFDQQGLAFHEFSSGKLLDKFPFPAEMAALENMGIQFDLANDAVFVASKNHAFSLPFGKLNLKLTRRLTEQMPTRVRAFYGQPLKISLKVAKDVRTKLGNTGQQNVQIVDNEILWEPDASLIGEHQLEVVAFYRGYKKTHWIDVTVQTPRIELGFEVLGVDVDNAGRQAVVWDKKNLAVVNLEDFSIESQIEVKGEIRFASMDQQFVYYKDNKRSLCRVTRNGLNKREVVETVAYSAMALYDEQHFAIVAMSRSNKSIVALIRKDDFEMVDISSWKPSFRFGPLQTYRQIATDRYQTPCGIEDEKGNLLVSASAGLLPIAGGRTSAHNDHGRVKIRGGNRSDRTFGRLVQNIEPRNGKSEKSQIKTFQDKEVKFIVGNIHVEYRNPVAFRVHRELEQNGMHGKDVIRLETISLKDGEPLDSQVIESKDLEYQIRQQDWDDKTNKHLDVAGSRRFGVTENLVLIGIENKLYVVPMTTSAAKAPVPFHLRWPVLPLLDQSKKFVAKIETAGGKGKVQFELIDPPKGVSIDSGTGILTIDAPAIWQRFLKRRVQNSPATERESERNRQNIERWFRTLVKMPLPENKLPLAVPVFVMSTDENGERDQRQMFAFVVGERPRSQPYPKFVNLPQSVKAYWGKRLEIPLQLEDPSQTASATFDIGLPNQEKIPASIRIENQALVIEAKKSGISFIPITITGELDGMKFSQRLNINVQTAAIPLEFAPEAVAIQPDEKHALVWGAAGNKHSLRSTYHLAVLDLDELSVVASTNVGFKIQSALMMGDYVVVAPFATTDNEIYRYDRQTLRNRKKISFKPNTSHQVQGTDISRYGPNRIALMGLDMPMQLIDLESAILVKRFNELSQMGEIRSAMVGQYKLVDNRYLESPIAIRNVMTGELLFAKSRGGIPSLSDVPEANEKQEPESTHTGSFDEQALLTRNLDRYGNEYVGKMIYSKNGDPIFGGSNDVEPFLCHELPAFFTFRSRKKSRNTSYERLRVSLNVHQLMDGSAIQSIEFINRSRKIGSRTYRIKPIVDASKEHLAVAAYDECFVIPFENDVRAKLQQYPLHFSWQKQPRLTLGSKQTISVQAMGGAGGTRYRMAKEFEGIHIEETTGLVTLDVVSMRQSWFNRNNYLQRQKVFGKTTNADESTPTIADWYYAITNEALRDNQTPFAIPIHVIAEDQAGNSDEIQFYTFVVITETFTSNRLRHAARTMDTVLRYGVGFVRELEKPFPWMKQY